MTTPTIHVSRETLHAAICQVVMLLNMTPESEGREALDILRQALADYADPIPMVLHCPACGLQHIDKPEGSFIPGFTAKESMTWNDAHGCWANPPHRSHLCHGCRHIWRPTDVATTGVAAVTTKGGADSPTAVPKPANPACPDCGAPGLLYECVHCSASNYPNDIESFGNQVAQSIAQMKRGEAARTHKSAKPIRLKPRTLPPEDEDNYHWRPIETAPRNTPVLLLTNAKWKDCRPGTQFVGIHRDDLSEWCFYAPVGFGGIPDTWLDGWMPLHPSPQEPTL